MRISLHLLGALALALSAVPAAGQGRWVDLHGREGMEPRGVFADIIEPLNQTIRLPHDMTIEMTGCGEPGAFYLAALSAVQICYELVDVIADRITSEGADGEMAYGGRFAFIALHQVGHALIDKLRLPIDGPVELAADEFAAVMAARAPNAYSAVPWGGWRARAAGTDWEHPEIGNPGLGEARSERLACLMYGVNPDAHEWMIGDEGLSEDAAARCRAEFPAVQARWMEMLAPHLHP